MGSATSTAVAGPVPIAGLAYDDLHALLAAHEVPAAHADRLVRACLRRGVRDLGVIPDLGVKNAERLSGSLSPRAARVVARDASEDGTVKLLIEGRAGDAFESVLMPLSKRLSGCVSSQVGCAAGCAFCASGLLGLKRSLEPWEIVEQVLYLADEARARGGRLSNLVFMGMGEPLHAYTSVVAAIRRLVDPRLVGFGCGHITVSTVGVVPGIRALAEEDLGVHLAVSIHAADDELRKKLLPAGGRFPVAEVLEAAEAYRVRTKRFVTLQVTLLSGVNDGLVHAEALAHAIAGRRFHVNLIPVNAIPGAPYEPPSQATIEAFRDALLARGVVVHVRARRGSDVAAACGQLRRRAATAGRAPEGG